MAKSAPSWCSLLSKVEKHFFRISIAMCLSFSLFVFLSVSLHPPCKSSCSGSILQSECCNPFAVQFSMSKHSFFPVFPVSWQRSWQIMCLPKIVPWPKKMKWHCLHAHTKYVCESKMKKEIENERCRKVICHPSYLLRFLNFCPSGQAGFTEN